MDVRVGSQSAVVVGVHLSGSHSFSKQPQAFIDLLEGRGVEGDAHCGAAVQHRSRVTAGAAPPNLRQVHLIHSELFDDLREAGYDVGAGELGENITTRGIVLLELPVGTRLTIGDAVVTITGLRNPCQQINDFRDGLLKQVVRRDEEGNVVRLTGIMGIVSHPGRVRPGATIRVDLPPLPHHPLTPV
jgi:MOSC domain-containing protein YiiM